MNIGEMESELFTHRELLILTTALVMLKENTEDEKWSAVDEDIYCRLLNRFTNLLECEEEIVKLAQLVQDEYL